jgi:hypothetical protein
MTLVMGSPIHFNPTNMQYESCEKQFNWVGKQLFEKHQGKYERSQLKLNGPRHSYSGGMTITMVDESASQLYHHDRWVAQFCIHQQWFLVHGYHISL